MKRAIKRILMGLTLLAGGGLLMYGLGLGIYHAGTWLASSFADSVIYEQDTRTEQARGRVAANSIGNYLRSK